MKLPQRVYDAIFNPAGVDLPVVREAAKTAAPHTKEQRLLLSIVRGADQAKKKAARTARYLRHYRRIAASLS